MARYRRLSADFDYTFGASQENFLVNSAEMVAQSIRTRLLLWVDEWFADLRSGTPYPTQVLGSHTKPTYDDAIRQRILDTAHVVEILEYSSNVNVDTRALTVDRVRVQTEYGEATLEAVRVQTGLFAIDDLGRHGVTDTGDRIIAVP